MDVNMADASDSIAQPTDFELASAVRLLLANINLEKESISSVVKMVGAHAAREYCVVPR